MAELPDNVLTVATASVERRRRRLSSSSHDATWTAGELRKARGQVEELTQELARVKLDLAEAAVGAEQRRMETRQALLRESQALREVDTARSYITVLEQKVREGGFWQPSTLHTKSCR